MKKLIVTLLLIAFTGLLAAGFLAFQLFEKPNVTTNGKSKAYLYIRTGSSLQDVQKALQHHGFLKHPKLFAWAAQLLHYERSIKPGKYELLAGMNNRDLISFLSSGMQTPVKISFQNIRTQQQLVERVYNALEADSLSLRKLLHDKTLLSESGHDPSNVMSLFVSGTFEFQWNTSAEQFIKRMQQEYRAFWNAERKQAANKMGLDPKEVTILASIVQLETSKEDERSTIAGVYLNRYRKNWKLEADPTLVFASGDFQARRILNEHKAVDSPYNTYKNFGLPPGPICIPSCNAVDAVLENKQHAYMFFCAKEDFSGYHNFAVNYSEQQRNARKFHQALNKRNIKS